MKKIRCLMQTKSKDLLKAASLAIGGLALITSVTHMRRLLVPANTRTVNVSDVPSTPKPIPQKALKGDQPIQLLEDGVGKLFHRRYHVDIKSSRLSKNEIISKIIEDPNDCSPIEVMRFEKTKGRENTMAVGDEYVIHIAGPWNGPVRVIDVTDTSFSFITLQDHVEAGEIQFRVLDHPKRKKMLRFEIRSWSRSRDKIVDFAYDKVPLVSTAQQQVWVYFCQQVVELSAGKQVGKVEVITERTDYKPQAHSSAPTKKGNPAWKQYEAQLTRYRTIPLNYDVEDKETFTKVNGWRLDEYKTSLPSEPKGEPIKNGSWELAKQVLLNYEFPDPSLVTGIFIPDDPIEKRVMIIKARFLLFSFYFGVRIASVTDETCDDPDKGKTRIWGYSYRTLEGHFEMGEIFFEVRKYLETGEVMFRIHSYSKTGRISNPFYRVGFALFGRGLQVRFAREALKRMEKLVKSRLRNGKQTNPLQTPNVSSTASEPLAEAEFQESKQ